MQKAIKYLLLTLMAVVVMSIDAAAITSGPEDSAAPSDTIVDRRQSEGIDMQVRMVQSAYPVQINIVGNAISIKSNYNQILPIYTEGGAFYAAFRLNKGTNWLSGLPRGTYYINNRKVTIP